MPEFNSTSPMAKRVVKNIINEQCRKLKKLIKKVNKHFEPESIHQLRVEYKKLRAFLRMLSEEIVDGKELKLGQNIKNVYRIAGKIRDLQLQKQGLLSTKTDALKTLEAYLQILEQDINKLKAELAAISLKKSIKKFKTLRGKKINTNCGINFIGNNCAAITTVIACDIFTDADLHAIRKRLKDIFYTIHLFDDINMKLKFGSSSITKEQMKYLDGLLEELGNFQDMITSLALLNDKRLNLLSREERNELLAIKETTCAGKNSLKNRIVVKLQNELMPHLRIFLLPVKV